MSSDPIPEDANPEIDEGTISDVIRKPTRAAGDLSEVGDATDGITMEDVARDLESVASKSRTAIDRELLEDLIRRGGAHRAAPRNCQYGPRRLHEVSEVVNPSDLDDPPSDDLSPEVVLSILAKALSDENEDQLPDDHPPHEDTSRQQPPEPGRSGPHLGPGSI